MTPAIWAEIHRLREIERLSLRAIERRVHCSRKTIKKALARTTPPPLKEDRPSHSMLDPYSEKIAALVDREPELSTVRVLEEIRKDGYAGEITLIRNYLRKIRPARGRVYQEVEYRPGQAMQVDWGDCGTVAVRDSSRKLSVFVAVLCYSRMIYVKFTLSQSKEVFYRAIADSLEFFGQAPESLIVDNLKAAVAEGYGRNARFHPEFASLCGHYRMKPIACDRYDPESKGTVEAGVRYVKHNALNGREEELSSFQDYQRLAVYWRDDVANVRTHATTKERPVDRLEKEKPALQALPPSRYDTDEIASVVVTTYARVRFDSNRYSVHPDFHRKPATVRADDKRVLVFSCGQEIAQHRRSYEKDQTILDPEHQKAALGRRKRSQTRRMESEFDALGAAAKAFRDGLLRAPVKPIVHLRRIFGLLKLYGRTEVLAALELALKYETFDAAYVQNLIDQERRRRHAPSPIPLSPQRRDLIEDVEIDEPDPGRYDVLLREDELNPENNSTSRP